MTVDQAPAALEPSAADHPQDLTARARAAHAQAVERQRLVELDYARQLRQYQTELLARRLRELDVADPVVTWDAEAGPVSVVDGLRFELDHDEDLVLVSPCPDCGQPRQSFPLAYLADVGALLEGAADWAWHSCEDPEPTGEGTDQQGARP
jgi:hypothetical protein